MKIHPLTSLSAKLFLAMSSLVLLTVVGVTMQNARTFLAYQREQVEDSLQQQAERAAGQVERVIETAKAQLGTALPTLIGNGEVDAALRRYVEASRDVVALQLYEVPVAGGELAARGAVFTAKTSDPQFGDKSPDKMRDKVRDELRKWIKKKAPTVKKDNTLITSLAKQLGLPIFGLAVRFDSKAPGAPGQPAGTPTYVWAVVAMWQNEIIKTLPKSKWYDSALVDDQGKIFASPTLTDMLERRAFRGVPLVKAAAAGDRPSGFVDEYRGPDGKHRLGAFARQARYGLAVLVEQDAEAAREALSRNNLATMLVASLFLLVAVMAAWLVSRGITAGLRDMTHATSRIAGGDLTFQVKPRSRDEVGALGEAVNQMARRISELLRSQVEKARFEKELETAKMVQATFFPRTEIKRPDFTLTGFYQPASECGGDIWGHYSLGDGREFIYIGDATGHGAPAALVTAMAYAANVTVADMLGIGSTATHDPAETLRRLNRIIYGAVRGKIAMTMFAAVVDLRRGTMIFSNAGHTFPILIPQATDDPRTAAAKPVVKGGDVRLLSIALGGMPLGMDSETTFKSGSLSLRPGDKIFFYTDGLVECSSPAGKVWGRKYLLEQIAGVAKANAGELKDEILGRAFTFFGTKALDDDVTVVVAEISPEWQGASASPDIPLPVHAAPARAPGLPPPFVMEAVAVEELPEAPMQAVSGLPPPPPTPHAPAPPVPAFSLGDSEAGEADAPMESEVVFSLDAFGDDFEKDLEGVVPTLDPELTPNAALVIEPVGAEALDALSLPFNPAGDGTEPPAKAAAAEPVPAPAAAPVAPQPQGKYKLKLPSKR